MKKINRKQTTYTVADIETAISESRKQSAKPSNVKLNRGLLVFGPKASGKSTLVNQMITQQPHDRRLLISNYYSYTSHAFLVPWTHERKPIRLIVFEGVHFDYELVSRLHYEIGIVSKVIDRPMPSVVFTFTTYVGGEDLRDIPRDQFDLIELCSQFHRVEFVK